LIADYARSCWAVAPKDEKKPDIQGFFSSLTLGGHDLPVFAARACCSFVPVPAFAQLSEFSGVNTRMVTKFADSACS
jgi:hypothetical protein